MNRILRGTPSLHSLPSPLPFFLFTATIFALTLCGPAAMAIDLRIASWNMRNRPNDTPTDTEDGDNLAIILSAMGSEEVLGTSRPLDILSMAETDTNSTPDIVSIFNATYSGSTYASAQSAADGGGDRTGFIYNTDTVSLLNTAELSTGLVHNILRGEFRPVGTSGEADFFFYSIHLRSGDTNAIEDQRSDEADLLRADADAFGLTAPIIYGGDFNWNDVDESNDPNDSAWDVFTGPGAGQGFDTFDVTNVAGAGDWRDNPAFLELHSQSPGASMDDRFNAQLVTDEFFDGLGLELVQGSYRVFGNNGTHTLNDSIGTGTGASASVLAALEQFSDHLPVVSDFVVLAIPEPSSAGMLMMLLGGAMLRRR